MVGMAKLVFVVIPNYNGADDLTKAVDSVLAQSYAMFNLIIVDNASSDGSREIIERYCQKDQRVRGMFLGKNYGYTGGVNPGLQAAINEGAVYAAPFNNDAAADKHWLKHLVEFLDAHDEYGAAACNLLHLDGKTFDSTGDQYSSWGLPYPRGRDEPVSKKYEQDADIFGASGGASLYRVAMLEQIGLFDQDFFAYYEDIDLSFRAQLAGWKVRYVPSSIVYHAQGVTSARIGNGFTTYQYMKNLPWVILKDLPLSMWPKVLPRFLLAYAMSFANATFKKGNGWPALRGLGKSLLLTPKKLGERRHIQHGKKVSNAYIWGLFLHDLPPNAHKLRAIRARWQKMLGHKPNIV